MTRGSIRLAAAAALAGLAVLLPCGAWYASAAHDLERETAERLAAPQRAAREATQRLASGLATRLEGLVAAESTRPYYHYQNLYHDPHGASEGVSVLLSPLAGGPSDPLVWTYFQIDPRGRVTLPTLNPELREKALQPDEERQRAVQRALSDAAPSAVALLAADAPRSSARDFSGDGDPTRARGEDVKRATRAGEDVERATRVGTERQVEQIDASSYRQNLNASQLYSQLKSRSKLPSTATASKAARPDSVTIELSPFAWHTLPVGGQPTLAALRVVSSPEGRRVQGFALALPALAQLLGSTPFPARFVPAPALAGALAAAPVGSTGWGIVVEPDQALALARRDVELLRGQFRRNFGIGMVAAMLAASGLVGLVWQSDRVARERSQFAAAAAHELRTPLAGLRMHAEMLTECLGDPARRDQYARWIGAEAERLGRVVGNVLGFTRLERGMLSVRPQPGDLTAVVRAAAERQRPALEAAGMTLSTDVADMAHAHPFDPDAVALIIQNLLDNAERHTRAAADRRVLLSLRERPEGVELGVRDHGPGVPEARWAAGEHELAARRSAGSSAGLGLGLVLVGALARAHGGRLLHDAPQDGGARFRVLFPFTVLLPR